MKDYATELPDFYFQAVELPQTHLALWPTNCLGEHATIAELMSGMVQLLKVQSDHHHPCIPCSGNDHPIGSIP